MNKAHLLQCLPPGFAFVSSVFAAPFTTYPMLNLTYGKVAVVDQEAQPDRIGVEYRFRAYGKWKLIPAIGLARADGDVLFHLSNGGISNQNPGTEAVALSLCIPLLPK